MYDRLLVPTDGSGRANAASNWPVESRRRRRPFTYWSFRRRSRRQFAGRTRSDGSRNTRRRSSDRAADVETVVTEEQYGDPRPNLEYIASVGIELVVMGAHGRREAEPVVLGRVTEGVVRHAPVPYSSVRASDDIQSRYPFDRVLVPTDGSEHARVAVERGVEIAAETGRRFISCRW